MTSHLTASWLKLKELQNLFHLFEKEGVTIRLVGGSVRDGLLGLPVNDIDLAVDREPQWVLNYLKAHNITAIPTGIDHGTITAVFEKRPYQITTLRVDVKTFGRKAHVAFTEDWTGDAARRDFTINAIYADKDGHLFDPVGGLEDLKNHRVRFIGDATKRIQEDYLRILRFFRFSARFGREPYDEEGLKACAQYASHLPHLARERVTEEFLKLLELSSPLYALREMGATGVLPFIIHLTTWEVLESFFELEKTCEFPVSVILRLAAFNPLLIDIKTHLRLSNKQMSDLLFLLKDHDLILPSSFKQQAYLLGKDRALDLSLLQTAQRVASHKMTLEEGTHFLKEMHHLSQSWRVPAFPLTGEDILSHGVKEGKQIGTLLKMIESWWLEENLEPNRKACLSYLSTLL
jgi:poly(A) polymerase